MQRIPCISPQRYRVELNTAACDAGSCSQIQLLIVAATTHLMSDFDASVSAALQRFW
jgi:hypothetical protein